MILTARETTHKWEQVVDLIEVRTNQGKTL
jgi:hypothetical protein